MLLKVLLKATETVITYKQRSKHILMMIAAVFMFISPIKYEIATMETFFHHLSFDHLEWIQDTPVKHEDLPPNQTIFIRFTGSEEMKTTISKYIDRIRIRAKSIKMKDEDNDFEGKNFEDKNFFLRINLYEDAIEAGWISPMKTNQPNSDLIALMKEFFPLKPQYKLTDVFEKHFHNILNISINRTEKSIHNFMNFLRCCININSHSHGTYYYVPLKDGLIRAEAFFGFIICMILYEMLDFTLDCRYFSVLVISLVYYYIPPVIFLFTQKNLRPIILFISTVLNFRFGVLYGLLIYFIEIKKTVSLFWKSKSVKKCN